MQNMCKGTALWHIWIINNLKCNKVLISKEHRTEIGILVSVRISGHLWYKTLMFKNRGSFCSPESW